MPGPASPGIPPGPPPPPPNPYAAQLAEIFQPVPADTEPQTAALRAFELGRALASTKLKKWPPPWRQGLILAYQQAREAAQLPDAKLLQGLQQELQKTKEELQNAKIKLNAASVSFSGKLADLDEQQTLAIMAKEGIQLPPRSRPVDDGKEPTIPPELQLAHEREMHSEKLAAESHQTRIKASADIEREKIKAAAAAHREEQAHAREALLMRHMEKGKEKPKAPIVHVHVGRDTEPKKDDKGKS